MGDPRGIQADTRSGDLRRGPVPHAIPARDGEALGGRSIRGLETAGVVQVQDQGRTRAPQRGVGRAARLHLLAVGEGLGQQRKTGSDRSLPGGMDVVLVARVGDHRDPHVGKGLGHVVLGLAQFGPIALDRLGGDVGEGALAVLVPRRELHGQEGEVALVPITPPVADHVGEEAAVLPGPTGVGFALVPDGPGDRVGHERAQHAVVEFGRAPGGTRGSLGELLALGFGLGLGGAPLRECRLMGPLDRHVGVEDVAGVERVGLDGLLAHPHFGRRSTPAGVDQAHGNTQGRLEVTAEIITHGGESADGLGRGGAPGMRSMVQLGLRHG